MRNQHKATEPPGTDEHVLRFSNRHGAVYLLLDGKTLGSLHLFGNTHANNTAIAHPSVLGTSDVAGSAVIDNIVPFKFPAWTANERIVLEFEEGQESLVEFPWEAVLRDKSGSRIALVRPFARRIGHAAIKSQPQVTPLKVLVVICEPVTFPPISGRRFYDTIVKEAKKHAGDVKLQLKFLPQPTTIDMLARERISNSYDIIHFIGHGDKEHLYFEDENWDALPVKAASFYEYFQGNKLPRLIVLTACSSSAMASTDFNRGTATAMVQAGIPNVLAMSMPIAVESALKLTGDMYAGLGTLPVDQLVLSLRKARMLGEGRRTDILRYPSWEIPVLYMQEPGADLVVRKTGGKESIVPWPPASPTHYLPGKTVEFTGRGNLIVEINEKLAVNNVVVLNGESGMGKSCLAAELAHKYSERGRFPGGIIWIDLQEGGDSPSIIERIARIIMPGAYPDKATVEDHPPLGFKIPMDSNMKLGQGSPMINSDSLIRELNSLEGTASEMLIILDNFETIVDAAAVISLVKRFPEKVKSIVTCTRKIRLGATVTVGEMAEECAGTAGLSEKESEALFRIIAENAGWDGSQSAQIASICGNLGHMPLAIRLVASQAGSASIDYLLKQVELGLAVISDDDVALPARHRSMQAAFTVACAALPPEDRESFYRLSIFPGRFSADTAAEICEIRDCPIFLRICCDLGLTRFKDGSYSLHGLIRRYAAARLEEILGVKDGCEKRFTAHYVEKAWMIGNSILSDDQDMVRVLDDADMENIIHVMSLSLQRRNLSSCIYLSGFLKNYLLGSGNYGVAQQVASIALQAARETGRGKLIAQALLGSGQFTRLSGDNEGAIRDLSECKKIYESGNQYIGLSMVLCRLAWCYFQGGDVTQADVHITKGFKLKNRIKYILQQAVLLVEFAEFKYILADYLHERSKYGVAGENKRHYSTTGASDWEDTHYRSELESCRKRLYKAAEIFKSFHGSLYSLAYTYLLIGRIESDLHYTDKARDYCQLCLNLARANKWSPQECRSLITLAGIARNEQQFEEAERILLSFEGLIKEININGIKGDYYYALYQLHEAVPGMQDKAVGELLSAARYRSLGGSIPGVELSALAIKSRVKKMGKKKFSAAVAQANSHFQTNFHPLLTEFGITVS